MSTNAHKQAIYGQTSTVTKTVQASRQLTYTRGHKQTEAKLHESKARQKQINKKQ